MEKHNNHYIKKIYVKILLYRQANLREFTILNFTTHTKVTSLARKEKATTRNKIPQMTGLNSKGIYTVKLENHP